VRWLERSLIKLVLPSIWMQPVKVLGRKFQERNRV
jgi:hypothetical protein